MKKKTPQSFFQFFRRSSRRLKAVIVVLLSMAIGSAGLQAQGPAGGVVRAGDARITGQGTPTTRIDQTSERAIIDWRSFGIGTADQVVFQQPSTQSATLNRVTGDQVSAILGRLDANGSVLLINPNGIVFGGGAQINVGSLIASTSGISDANFMSGKLVFDQPGRRGAGIFNAGALTARDGGLVALVAPHVRNDGVIVARLGKVVLGSADTFTVDLYGDTLINLALSDAHAGQLVGLNGEPVTSLIKNNGQIETAGGQTVLMTARNAKNVLDSLINMSGTIKADTAVQQGGRILLLGEGGKVDVNGSLSAQGATGGSIEVLGDRVALGSAAALDASGLAGGGTVHVGGAYQGTGDTYRSSLTTVEAGATLRANAIEEGTGGEVVVWSDGHTEFGGLVEAKGGAGRGDGGLLEVSGKRTLNFFGQANASALGGRSGSLLLDPETLTIGATEAGALMRVLRTGTTTNVQADVDINVDSPILGGDRTAGGGLNMTAGRNINVNDFIVTHNGAINLNATAGTVTVAPGKAVFAGTAPITVTASGDLFTGSMLTNGALSFQSLAGKVAIDAFIDEHTGPVSIRAAGNVDINQPIVSMASGNTLSVIAGTDINVNAQVDGRGEVEGGTVTMTANRDLNVNQAVVTNNATISLTATNGAINTAAAPLVSGSGAIALTARGNVASGQVSGGSLTMNSATGSVGVNGLIDALTGATRITAATDVTITEAILNGQSGAGLNVSAGRDITVNAMVDGRGGVAGGAIVLNAARNLTLTDYLLTNNAAIDLSANGTLAAGRGTFSGTGAIAMRSVGDLTLGVVSGASLTANSTAGSVRVNGVIDGGTGRVDLTAARDVAINAPIINGRSGAAFTATAGQDVIVNSQIDSRGGAAGGSVALRAARNVFLGNFIATNNGQIGITASGGAAAMAPGTALVSGNAAISLTASGDVRTQGISGGSLSATSTGGSVNIDGVIDGNTGRVDLSARRDVNINAPVLNTKTGASFNASAGGNINVNAQIDGTNGNSGGAVNLTASGDLNVNAPIATRDGEIRLSATNGTATVVPTAGLFAGGGSISLNALGNVITSAMIGGPMNITSGAGSIFVGGPVFGTGGAMNFGAAGSINIANAITNFGVSPLTVSSGSDITVNAAVGRTAPGVASGSVTMNAAANIRLNESIVTQDGAIGLTATSGGVITAGGKGLFSGAGAISIQQAQTLDTPLMGTTGAVTLRSTDGGVNLNTALNGGAVTITAATDVNLNQGIGNSRADAQVSVTAGRNITVNAAIDGRSTAPTGPSGGVSLIAGNNVTLNQNIVTNNAAVGVTATGGALTVAAGQGIYSGSGGISLTSAATLDTPLMSTTGTMNLRSTAGDVNITKPIGDTVGSVTIAAGNAVNVGIGQTITNLKSGGNLTITAGTDIGLLAQIDGRGGPVAGGTVTMTAGNNIIVPTSIATNNGAVSLTATNGTITLPVGFEVVNAVFDAPTNTTYNQITTPMQASIIAGNAPVSLTSGGNFTLTSPIDTTGALNLRTTGGNLTLNAPIDDETGAVTISAGNGLVVNREIRTNNQAVTLNAGAGGVLINQIDDKDYSGTSSVNAKAANLTINSVGNVTILDNLGVASTGTVTIDTRAQIVSGNVGDALTGGNGRPQAVVLNADGGIASFNTRYAGSVTATSSGGSINLEVTAPGRLRVTTGTPGTLDCPTCDIAVTGTFLSIGPDVILNAGGSVNMPAFSTTTAQFIARSGDINFGGDAIIGDTFTGSAGRDIVINKLLWMGPGPQLAANPVLPGGGPLSLTAGRDLVTFTTSPIHVSNSQLATFVANRNLTLFTLETLGGVSLTANTGNVTLNTDIGAHIINTNPVYHPFNPGDLGVAFFTLSAPSATAAVNMQGVRAQGNVNISTGGTLIAGKQITSVFGSVSIFAAGGATLSAVPIGNVDQVIFPPFNAPGIPPGPRAPAAGVPGLAGNGAPGLPAFAEIAVGAGDQIVGGVNAPGANGGVGLGATTGGASAPQGRGGANSRPGLPSGADIAQPNGDTASDRNTIDPASALRAAGEKCGEDGGSAAGTGLDAAAPKKGGADAAGGTSASCAATAPAGGAAGGAAGGSGTPGTPADPNSKPVPPTKPGGGVR